MKINCFAYNPEKGCRALLDDSSCGENCSFRKSRAELETGRIKAYRRLALLPDDRQRYIADTYHRGRRVWMEPARKAVDV